jgi:HPt (histidine-containing phosphotransfer) domain-containing protein
MPEVIVDLLDTYLEESAGLIATMQEAVLQGNTAAILRPAHSLKSSSASVGAMRLSRLAAELETFLRGSSAPMDVPAQVTAIAQEFALVRAALEKEKARLG